MEDLTIDFDDWRLNCRAGVIITHNNKILVHHNLNETYYALIGGRVKLGEDSENTVKREIKEELGKDIELTGYIATIENFFNLRGKKYHEIMFIHKAEFLNEKDRDIQCTLENIEEKKDINYEWIDLKDIDKAQIKPDVIKNVLKQGIFPQHIINNEFLNSVRND